MGFVESMIKAGGSLESGSITVGPVKLLIKPASSPVTVTSPSKQFNYRWIKSLIIYLLSID